MKPVGTAVGACSAVVLPQGSVKADWEVELGVVIGRQGWIDGAQQELRRAVELDPAYADAHYNLAAFYLEEKPPAVELAKRHYFKAIELGVEKDPAMEKVLPSSQSKP
jgi:Tfp pilus assembly protein PilF